MAKRILVTGSRDWTDEDPIRNVLGTLVANGAKVLIHGAAPGADSIAAKVAKELGMGVIAFPAEWDKWGKSAGPIRNTKMLKEGKPDCVIAFPTEGSVGTLDMIRKAEKAGVTVWVYGPT
jgi:D-arabinose 1-dehydrogenase-like Zn-dependent alcohol dehydrogenase